MNRITDFFKDDFFAFERTGHFKYKESKFITPNKTFFTHNLFVERDKPKTKPVLEFRNKYVFKALYTDTDTIYSPRCFDRVFGLLGIHIESEEPANDFNETESNIFSFDTYKPWYTDIYMDDVVMDRHHGEEYNVFNERINGSVYEK